jgi:anti-sigma B factor antagonist
MGMKITEHQVGEVAVMDLRGALAGRNAVEALDTAVRRRCRDGTRRVVANFAGVPSVDLAGLGALVDAQMALRRAGVAFTLACVTKRIHDLVVITRLLTVFDTCDSIEEAVGGAAPTTGGPEAPGLSLTSLGTIQRFLRRA